jgi:hypothetical protein
MAGSDNKWTNAKDFSPGVQWVFLLRDFYRRMQNLSVDMPRKSNSQWVWLAGDANDRGNFFKFSLKAR